MNIKCRHIRYLRNRIYYCQDTVTGKQQSLGTKNRLDAERIVHARNEAERNPTIKLQIARAYRAGSDPDATTRTWKFVMDEMAKLKAGNPLERWHTAMRDSAFDLIRKRPLLETRPEHLLKVMEDGTVSTNVFLRRLHNFAADMSWLPWPVVPKKRWPRLQHKSRRGITADEHAAIVEREPNVEMRTFYQLLWHLGGSQSDVANLQAEDIDWTHRVVSYQRKKTGTISLLRFGDTIAELLGSLPKTGCLFPRVAQMHEKHRAKEFRRRCLGLGFKEISLHSYRYAWAERAMQAGYPERFAQEALGHQSAAIHRAYAKKARVELPPLEDYERQQAHVPALPRAILANTSP